MDSPRRIFSLLLAVLFGCLFETPASAQDLCVKHDLTNCCDETAKNCPSPTYIAADGSRARKIVLVIGVDNYGPVHPIKDLSKLDNARNDAVAIGKTFEKAGATVRYLFDPTLYDLDTELSTVASHIKRVERRDGPLNSVQTYLIIYYAGHGLRLEETDYLVLPVELGPAETVEDLDDEDYLYPTRAIGAYFGGSRDFDITFIFDACRSAITGLPERADGRSRGEVSASFEKENFDRVTQQLLVLSTSEGLPASDSAKTSKIGPLDENLGPYAYFLKFFLEKPGLKFNDTLNIVKTHVRRAFPNQLPDDQPAGVTWKIQHRKFRDVPAGDQCAKADLGLWASFVGTCKEPRLERDPDCMQNYAAYIDGLTKPLLESCKPLKASMKLLDPEGRFLNRGRTANAASPIALETSAILKADASGRPEISSVGNDGTSELVGSEVVKGFSLDIARRVKIDEEFRYFRVTASGDPNGFDPNRLELFPRDPGRVDPNNLDTSSVARLYSNGGLHAVLPETTSFFREPSLGSERIFSRVPDNSRVVIDCVNLDCTNDWVGASIYSTSGEAVYSFIPANTAIATTRLRAESISFEDGKPELTEKSRRKLADMLAVLPDGATMTLWAPPPINQSNAVILESLRRYELRNTIGQIITENGQARKNISVLSPILLRTAASELGPNTYLIELLGDPLSTPPPRPER